MFTNESLEKIIETLLKKELSTIEGMMVGLHLVIIGVQSILDLGL